MPIKPDTSMMPLFGSPTSSTSSSSYSTQDSLLSLMQEAKAYHEQPAWTIAKSEYRPKLGGGGFAYTHSDALRDLVHLEAESAVLECGRTDFGRSLKRSDNLYGDYCAMLKGLLEHDRYALYSRTPYEMQALLSRARKTILRQAADRGSLYSACKQYGALVRVHVMADILESDGALSDEMARSNDLSSRSRERRLGVHCIIKQRYQEWVQSEWEPFLECKAWIETAQSYERRR